MCHPIDIFSYLMQRIFKYGDTHNTGLTPDKEANNLIYGTPSYLITGVTHIHF